MSVDEIFREVENRALGNFNRWCASKKLGHWPNDGEAMEYFMKTERGYPDVLNDLGVRENPASDKPSQAHA